MFEKFDEKARRAFFFSRYEASKWGDQVIEPEHVLLGLLREGEGLVMELLSHFNVRPDDLRREITDGKVPAGEVSATAELPLREETTKIIAYAAQESESMHHKAVSSAHLLIALLRGESSVAQRVLVHAGLDLDTVREEIGAKDPRT